MSVTGLSNGGLNKCLSNLETSNLISRQKSFDSVSKRQRPTRYILGFEILITQEPTPLSGDGADSTTGAEPTPLQEQNRLHPSGDKPVKEPVNEPCVDEQHTHKLFQIFWKVHPRPREAEITEAAFMAAVASGVDPDWIVSSAKKYATEQKGNRTQYVKRSDNWLADELWKAFPRKIKTTGVERLDFYADLINGDRRIHAAISDSLAGELIASGKVTLERMRERLPA